MSCQMIRVISSPSSSTTGFFTLIFAINESSASGVRMFDLSRTARRVAGRERYSTGFARGKGGFLRYFSRLCVVPKVPDQPAAAAARMLGKPPVFRFHRALERRDAVILMQDRRRPPARGPDDPTPPRPTQQPPRG